MKKQKQPSTGVRQGCFYQMSAILCFAPFLGLLYPFLDFFLRLLRTIIYFILCNAMGLHLLATIALGQDEFLLKFRSTLLMSSPVLSYANTLGIGGSAPGNSKHRNPTILKEVFGDEKHRAIPQ